MGKTGPGPPGDSMDGRDPDSSPARSRRTFTADYKRRVLEELDACERRGEASLVLRREDLGWSHVAKWRKQRDALALTDFRDAAAARSALKALLQQREHLFRTVETLADQNVHLRRALAQLLGCEPTERALEERSAEESPRQEERADRAS